MVIDWWELFWTQLRQTSLLEYIGVTFGVLQVLFAKSNKVWLYPFGIANILITLYILFGAGLYAEVLLNVYYLVMSIYGWWYWVNGGSASETLPITLTSRREWGVIILFITTGTPILYAILTRFTDSTVPLWDSLVTVFAWAGMWLLAKRKLENWLLLNLSNLLAIPLLIYKGLALFALLTLFLFIIAIFGFLEWKKIYSWNSTSSQLNNNNF
jgi:nicotinamide mononucleotide transporter